jgi:hypothetical protein
MRDILALFLQLVLRVYQVSYERQTTRGCLQFLVEGSLGGLLSILLAYIIRMSRSITARIFQNMAKELILKASLYNMFATMM